MARTWGQGRKLPKSSSTQDKFLQEDPTAPDGVAWADASGGSSVPDPADGNDGDVVTVESGEYILSPGGSGGSGNTSYIRFSFNTGTAIIPGGGAQADFTTSDISESGDTGITINGDDSHLLDIGPGIYSMVATCQAQGSAPSATRVGQFSSQGVDNTFAATMYYITTQSVPPTAQISSVFAVFSDNQLGAFDVGNPNGTGQTYTYYFDVKIVRLGDLPA